MPVAGATRIKALTPVARLYIEVPHRKNKTTYNVETYMECHIEKTDDDPPYVATYGSFEGHGTTMLEAAVNCFRMMTG